jgi:hypothetical protein
MANPRVTKPTTDKPAAKKIAKSDLVAVRKDGETIHISPLTLADHQRLGWRQVDVVLTADDVDTIDAPVAADEPGE